MFKKYRRWIYLKPKSDLLLKFVTSGCESIIMKRQTICIEL